MDEIKIDNYTIARALMEIQYEKMVKEINPDLSKVSKDVLSNTIYPYSWFSIIDDKFKLECLKEALNKKIYLQDTDCMKNGLKINYNKS